SPAAVSTKRSGNWSKSRAPIASSSALIRRATVGWLTSSLRAAAASRPSVASVRNTRRSAQSARMTLAPHLGSCTKTYSRASDLSTAERYRSGYVDRCKVYSVSPRSLPMHFEPRLWIFTEGVRLRILWAVFVGLVAVGFGDRRRAALGRDHTLADRWRRAARDLFRPVPAAVPDLAADAAIDLRGSGAHRSARSRGHAGLRAGGALRARALAPARGREL